MAAPSPPLQRRAAASAACGGRSGSRPEAPSLRQIRRKEGLQSRAATKCAGRLDAVPAADSCRARPQARPPRQALPPPHVAYNPTCFLLPFTDSDSGRDGSHGQVKNRAYGRKSCVHNLRLHPKACKNQ
uniref:Uncharacterized protein n=1 Tax=Oryza glumipatula TaxID=40148 RepID=A0A0D9Z8R2_9ORYZ